jgi:hypothetical protein
LARIWPDREDGLARLLKGFEVFPANVRTPSGAVVQGCTRQAFEETFRQYIPPPEGGYNRYRTDFIVVSGIQTGTATAT